ncbi:MGDG synthase family glycosyltransferase [Neobacillus sp. Marseille-QA0830]
MNELKKDKILILSASYGDGHTQVADAINEAIHLTHPNAESVMMDIMQWLHPFLFPVSHYVYSRMIKRFPQVYSYFYKKTRERSSFSIWLNELMTTGMGSMLEMIRNMQPSVVVCTYPFAAGIMSKLKENRLVDIPLVTIITDYTDHSYWVYPYTDQYIVGSKEVGDRLVALGVESDKIQHSGIPVHKKFVKSQPRESLASKYQLNPNTFTLLIMGGGEGFIGKGLSTFLALEYLPDSIQIIIVCGRNKRLKLRLEEQLSTSKHHILLLGYCDNIHEWMSLADLMITKPGGVTTSEALAKELPLLLYRPLPGQEEDNAKFLVESGLALLAENDEDLISKVTGIMEDTKPLDLMRQRSRLFHSKSASLDALEAIIQTRHLENHPYPAVPVGAGVTI